MAGFNMDDYVDVAERIRQFRTAHPEGSLQPFNPDKPFEIVQIGDAFFVVCVEAAFRSPDDTRPGVGTAWEPFPGKTQFTRESELMNAQTGAWGRAIVAALAADTKKIASAEEVRNRQAERAPVDPLLAAKNRVWEAAQKLGWDRGDLVIEYAKDNKSAIVGDASAAELNAYAETLEAAARSAA
jgi:hypothetical protein